MKCAWNSTEDRGCYISFLYRPDVGSIISNVSIFIYSNVSFERLVHPLCNTHFPIILIPEYFFHRPLSLVSLLALGRRFLRDQKLLQSPVFEYSCKRQIHASDLSPKYTMPRLQAEKIEHTIYTKRISWWRTALKLDTV